MLFIIVIHTKDWQNKSNVRPNQPSTVNQKKNQKQKQ